MKAKTWSALFLPLVSALGFGFELEQSTDLTLTFTPSLEPEITDVQDSAYELTGQADFFWNMEAYLTDSVTVYFRYGISAISLLDQDGSSSGNDETDDFRLDDLPAEFDPDFYQTLDLLNINYYSRFGDYTIGRQVISFGQAKFFSPVDVVYPKSLFAIDSDYRPGVDAFRATWPLNATSELELGYLETEERGGFARLKTYLLGSDWELIAIRLSEDNSILSIGTNGGIDSVGLWQESALLIDEQENKNYLRATIGADYTFYDDWYVAWEAHYNGIGERDDYSANTDKSFYQLGYVTPQAQWYSSIQASYPINILTEISLGATTNLNDFSTLLNSTLTFNATDELTVNASLLVPMASDNSTEYEYGVYPVTGIVQLDWVF